MIDTPSPCTRIISVFIYALAQISTEHTTIAQLLESNDYDVCLETLEFLAKNVDTRLAKVSQDESIRRMLSQVY